MASKVTIFHLERVYFPRNLWQVVKYSSENQSFPVKFCPTLLAIEYIVIIQQVFLYIWPVMEGNIMSNPDLTHVLLQCLVKRNPGN